MSDISDSVGIFATAGIFIFVVFTLCLNLLEVKNNFFQESHENIFSSLLNNNMISLVLPARKEINPTQKLKPINIARPDRYST